MLEYITVLNRNSSKMFDGKVLCCENKLKKDHHPIKIDLLSFYLKNTACHKLYALVRTTHKFTRRINGINEFSKSFCWYP